MRIGLAVILLAAALAARGDALGVRTAQVDDLTGASRVVTNVTFDAEGAFNAISNRADALIKAVAPATGDYGTVSNRAMSALQSHQSLAQSTNYTDAALGAFAETGTVARAATYGTPTRWTDATGCVWEATADKAPWTGGPSSPIVWDEETGGWLSENGQDLLTWGNGVWSFGCGSWTVSFTCTGEQDAMRLVLHSDSEVPDIVLERGFVTNLVGRVALTNDIPDVSGYATQQQATNAAVAVADAKISTNNAAFVEAVTNCPVVIASGGGGGGGFPAGDWSDYGTLGALLAAIIAAITWLKNNQRYALHTVTLTNGAGTLLDRAGNRVVVTGDTTLTLPAAAAGYARDFIVRLEISGSTVPTITFAAPTGETIVYETDGDDFPVPDEAGTWLYSFTETKAGVFAVALKSTTTVAQA